MDSSTRFKAAVVLGLVILVVDLIWTLNSVGGFAGRVGLYHNYTGNVTPSSGLNRTALPYHAGLGSLDLVYGVIIFAADLAWLYLEFTGRPKPSTRKK